MLPRTGESHAPPIQPSKLFAAFLIAGIVAGCSAGGDPGLTSSGGRSISDSSNAFLLPPQNAFTRAEVQIPMDDGVIITAEEFIPDLPHKVPTAIAFYPYGRKADIAGDHFSFPAEHGYAKLTVDVRGTGASEGVWDLFGPREQQDYAAIIQWATTRPYNDGSVVLQGVSAGAITALLAAQQPGTEAVKAVFARTPNADAFRDNGNSGGSPNTSFLLAWAGGTIGVPSLYQPALSAQTDPPVALNATSQHLTGTMPFVLGGLLAPVFGEYQGNAPSAAPGCSRRRIRQRVLPRALAAHAYRPHQGADIDLRRQLRPVPAHAADALRRAAVAAGQEETGARQRLPLLFAGRTVQQRRQHADPRQPRQRGAGGNQCAYRLVRSLGQGHQQRHRSAADGRDRVCRPRRLCRAGQRVAETSRRALLPRRRRSARADTADLARRRRAAVYAAVRLVLEEPDPEYRWRFAQSRRQCPARVAPATRTRNALHHGQHGE